MIATAITMEAMGTAVAGEARWRRKRGDSTGAAASLAAAVAAWQERGVEGGGQLGGGVGSLAKAQRWWCWQHGGGVGSNSVAVAAWR